jgi:hypothetical protein
MHYNSVRISSHIAISSFNFCFIYNESHYDHYIQDYHYLLKHAILVKYHITYILSMFA